MRNIWDQTNCTDRLPRGPKSARKVSPLRAHTGRVNDPESITRPGSSVEEFEEIADAFFADLKKFS